MIPLGYLPTPVGILEWELAQPPAPISGFGGFQVVRVLVRLRSRPIGWITIENPGEPIPFATVAQATIAQLDLALETAAVTDSFGVSTDDHQREWPRISVVVCTRDRPESLRRCLESLRRLEYPDYEVIVVDNASSTGDTAAVASEFPFRYAREERPGLDWARNRGISEARHEIIAFTDDDVVVDHLWLKGLAEGFAQADVMLVTGLVAPAEIETEAQLIFEYRYGGMSKGFQPTRWDPPRLSRYHSIGTHHLGLGANMAFHRAVFDRVGTFDTALDVGTPSHGAGDLDMFHRVLTGGGVACYQPTALVWHSHRRDLAALHRQLRDNGRAFGVYLLSQAFPATPRRKSIGRSHILGYSMRIWLAWMAGRLVRRLVRKEPMSIPLQASEIRGVFEAPWAFLATRRSDRRVRQSFSP